MSSKAATTHFSIRREKSARRREPAWDRSFQPAGVRLTPKAWDLAGITFSPGSKIPGGQNLGAILPQISPRFLPGRKTPDGQNLTGILPRCQDSCQEAKIWFRPGVPVHKGITFVHSLFRSHWLAVVYCSVYCIGSCEPVHEDRTKNPNSQNLAGILPWISPKFLIEKQKSRRPKSQHDPAGNVSKILARTQ